MPGISFLFKKGFHPATLENQKKLFIAEQSASDRARIEQERSQEVVKELDAASFESISGNSAARDARHSSLKFMYSQPMQKEKDRDNKTKEKNKASLDRKVGDDGDDDLVRAFKQKVLKRKTANTDEKSDAVAEGPTLAPQNDDIADSKISLKKTKQDVNFSATAHRSALEKETGKRKSVGLTMEEQAERFSFLKDAPLEGTFAKGIHVRHKPFNEIVRNVQCIRCGEWGHQSGDRECALRDYNPHDFARRKREDPLTYMQSSDFLLEKQKMILRHAAAAAGPLCSAKLLIPFGGDELEEPESDPESEFIATLTPREKKLLLRRLQILEGSSDVLKVDESSSSSDSSDSGESESDSDGDDVEQKDRDKRKERKRSKKNKKASKKDKKKEKN